MKIKYFSFLNIAPVAFFIALIGVGFLVSSNVSAAINPTEHGQLFVKLSDRNLDGNDVKVTATRQEQNGDAQSNFNLVYDSDKKEWHTKDTEPIIPYGGQSGLGCDRNSDKNRYRVRVTGSYEGESSSLIVVCQGYVDGGTITVTKQGSTSSTGTVTAQLKVEDGRNFQGDTSRITLSGPRTIKNYSGDDRDNGAITANWVTDGQLRIPNVPAGTYSLHASWVDLNESPRKKYVIEIQNIKVTGGETVALGVHTAAVPDGFSTEEDSEENEAEGKENNCENAGALGWIFCPVIYIIDNALEWVDGRIENLLDVDEDYYNNPGIKGGWTSIRNIAYLILVPIMLVMVIGTILGFSAIDAYTVKRALPRMLAAVIFISLSYDICVFLIELFNAIGRGTLGLLTAPFGEVTNSEGQSVVMSELSLRFLFGPSLLASLATAAVASIGLLIVLWVFGGSLLLFALVAFLVLVLRQMFLVASLLLAPLAILAWIFPGNDKLWKLWWGSFSKLLMMFPLIMGVIAAGRIFAFIIHESDDKGLDNIIKPLLTLAAYMIPYAFIPFTFKFAGEVFGTVTGGLDGMINSEGRKKARAAKRAEKWQRIGSDNVFSNSNKFGKYANKAMSWTAYPHKSAMYSARNKNIPFISARGRRIASEIGESASEQNEKLAQKLDLNDKGYRALSGLHHGLTGTATYKGRRMSTREAFKEAGIYGKALESEKDIKKAADILATSDNATEALAAAKLTRAIPIITSRHTDPEMNYSSVAAAGMIGLAAHGFLGSEDMEDAGKVLTGAKYDKESGTWVGGKNDAETVGVADKILTRAEVIGAKSRPDIKAGYGHVVKDDGQGGFKIVDGMSEDGGRAEALFETIGSGDIATSKGGFLKRMGPKLKQTILEGTTPEALNSMKVVESMSDADLANAQRSETGRNMIAQAKKARLAVQLREELFKTAYQYSHSPSGNQAEAQRIINSDRGLSEQFARQYKVADQQGPPVEQLVDIPQPPEEPDQGAGPFGAH